MLDDPMPRCVAPAPAAIRDNERADTSDENGCRAVEKPETDRRADETAEHQAAPEVNPEVMRT